MNRASMAICLAVLLALLALHAAPTSPTGSTQLPLGNLSQSEYTLSDSQRTPCNMTLYPNNPDVEKREMLRVDGIIEPYYFPSFSRLCP